MLFEHAMAPIWGFDISVFLTGVLAPAQTFGKPHAMGAIAKASVYGAMTWSKRRYADSGAMRAAVGIDPDQGVMMASKLA